MVRQRAHRNEGLRGPSSGSTRDKTKIDFFEPEIWAIPTCAHRSRARIDPFAFNSLAAWERKRIRFNGDISTVRFISTAGHWILSVFISTTEHEVTRAFRNANRARVTSQLFLPRGRPPLLFIFPFFFSSFSSCLCTKLKQYRTAFTTNHKKTGPLLSPLPRQITTVYSPTPLL